LKKDISENKKEIMERLAKEDKNELKKEREAKKNLDMERSFRDAKVKMSSSHT
jgi:hypothetical protein